MNWLYTIKKVANILVLLSYFVVAANSYGQYSLTGNSYAQNFNLLGTGNNTIAGGDLSNVNANLAGWFFSESGSNANTTISAGTGSGSTGDTYNFGLAGNADRTLGGLQTGTLNPTFGFYCTNNTGSIIVTIALSYTGKTWRVGTAARPDRLDFQFSTNATSLTNGTWNDFDALDYTNTAQATTGSGSIKHSVFISASLTGITILNGNTFFIRWTDFNASGSDDGMGIDDLSFTVITSAVPTSNATDYFRSKQSGDWSFSSSWQSSPDNVNWIDASMVPADLAAGINIRNGQTITVSNTQRAKLLTIDNGGILMHNTVSLTITDDGTSSPDFIINGTYVINGVQPVFNSSVSIVVNSGGEVRADDDAGAESDNFARSTQVLFKTGAVFRWNNSLAFETNAVTYFPSSGLSDNPIFRVTATPASNSGSAGSTTFNGKFEVGAGFTVTFISSGIKTFRDGLGGDGTLVHNITCGPFQLTGAGAVIDGNLTLNLLNNTSTGISELIVATGASVTVSGTPVINVGTAANTGSELLINGTIKHISSNAINIGYGSLTLNGTIDAASTGSFTTRSAYSNITVGGSTGGSAGTISFAGSASAINNFTINRTGSNANVVLGSDVTTQSLTLTKGIIATGNHLFTYAKTGALIAPNIPWVMNATNYSDSYVCTCDVLGVPITKVDGSQGFRISNVGNGADVYFPVGANFNSANRMLINNNGTTDDFTVAVGVGDIGGTPMPVIKRVWYVSEKTAGGSNVSMKLFFTKRDPYLYSSGTNDEVESGFDFADMLLVQKPDNGYADVAANADVLIATPGLYNMGTEMYGQLTNGVTYPSRGITTFSKFTIVNDSNYVLPLQLIDFTAYRYNNKILASWKCATVQNIQSFQVQRSVNGIDFIAASPALLVKNQNQKDYTYEDKEAADRKIFYRLCIINKNGKTNYSKIITVFRNHEQAAFAINPNPVVHHLLHVHLYLFNEPNCLFLIYDSGGKTIFTKQILNVNNEQDYPFQLPPSIKPGVYFSVLVDGTQTFKQRIIIN